VEAVDESATGSVYLFVRNTRRVACVVDGMNLFRHDPRHDELRRIPLFGDLSRERFEVLSRTADVIEVPAGTELIREGDSGREFFAISDGEVEVTSAAGPESVTEGPGEVFGELALLYGIPRTASVRTTAPSRLFVLNAQAFRSVVADSFV
jgi:CRP-like cAMP-binding protein